MACYRLACVCTADSSGLSRGGAGLAASLCAQSGHTLNFLVASPLLDASSAGPRNLLRRLSRTQVHTASGEELVCLGQTASPAVSENASSGCVCCVRTQCNGQQSCRGRNTVHCNCNELEKPGVRAGTQGHAVQPQRSLRHTLRRCTQRAGCRHLQNLLRRMTGRMMWCYSGSRGRSGAQHA